jgi:thioredoxin-related protein
MLKSNILFVLISLLCSTLTFGQVNFQTATHDEMLANAQKNQKPFLIVFGIEECTICKKMEQTTYSQANLAEYVHQNLTPYKVDALSFDGISIAQHFNVSQFPTLMIFDAGGKKICTIKGYNSAESLLAEFRMQISIINRLKETGNAIFVADAAPVESISKEDYTEIKEKRKKFQKEVEESEVSPKLTFNDKGEVERFKPSSQSGPKGAAAVTTYGVVAGLEAKSILTKRPQGFGIQVTSVSSIEELNLEVAKYSKRWKKDLWVYSQTINGNTSYYLLFGTFEEQDAADEMSKMMSDTFGINGSIINLNSIK